MITKISDLLKPDFNLFKNELKKYILNLKNNGHDCLNEILGAGCYMEKMEIPKEQIIELIINMLIMLRNTLNFRQGDQDEGKNLQEPEVNELIKKYNNLKDNYYDKVFFNLEELHKKYTSKVFESVYLSNDIQKLKKEVEYLEENKKQLETPWRI